MDIQQFPEPEEMSVAGSFADIHDVNDLVCHLGFIGHPVGIRKLFLDQVDREEKLVLQKEFIVSGFMPTLADNVLGFEQIAALMQNLSFGGFLILFPQRGTIGSQDVAGLLECPGRIDVAFLKEPPLFILPDFTDYLRVLCRSWESKQASESR